MVCHVNHTLQKFLLKIALVLNTVSPARKLIPAPLQYQDLKSGKLASMKSVTL